MLQTRGRDVDFADILRWVQLVCDSSCALEDLKGEGEGQNGKVSKVSKVGAGHHGLWPRWHFCMRTLLVSIAEMCGECGER